MYEHILKYWVTYAMGLIAMALAAMAKWIKSKFAKQDALTAASLALLHDKIYHYCTDYLERGSVSIDDLENLGHLFRAYKALGGNGTGEALYKRVQALPIKEKE